jgi:hypothetical protein
MDGEMFDYTEEYLRRALFGDSIGEWTEGDVFTDEAGDWEDPESVRTTRDIEHSDGRIWRGGEETVSGRIWGGVAMHFSSSSSSPTAIYPTPTH